MISGKKFLAIFSACLICIVHGNAQNVSTSPGNDTIDAPRPINIGGLKKLIAERHGKILFVNIWATWCEPCTEEFPDIVTLRNAFPDSLVDVVAVSVDYPDESESKVLPFLRTHSVFFPVYVADVKKQDDFINALDSSWSGAIPATFIFDGRGTQRIFLLGQKNFATFKSEVDSVLNFR